MSQNPAPLKALSNGFDALRGLRVEGGVGVVETFEAGGCRHKPKHKGHGVCVQASDAGHRYYRQTWIRLEVCPSCWKTGFRTLGAVRVSLGDGEPCAHAVACPGCQRVMFAYEALWGRGEGG